MTPAEFRTRQEDEMHSYQTGDTVHIINHTMSGTVFIEGSAVVLRLLPNDETYLVQFVGECEAPVERIVVPDAQANPAAFVASLNDPD